MSYVELFGNEIHDLLHGGKHVGGAPCFHGWMFGCTSDRLLAGR
jgi:hypothetical protein